MYVIVNVHGVKSQIYVKKTPAHTLHSYINGHQLAYTAS